MDAFFTIAPAVPETSAEAQPLEDILVECDKTGTSGNKGSCIIA
ncbi:pheromone [Trametes versicolor FP-101664 SS1]|nr:pheromone [Trametes versicolor FP-101664 SS1]EIW57109.1 pheromone [Trametes versicolor FP-101664 SS1]